MVALPVAGLLKGSLIGFLVSLPDTIVTKAYAPILTVGVVGGAIIGYFT